MSRPQSRYVAVDPNNPTAAAQCDRCGFWAPLRTLKLQYQWSGVRLYSTGSLVCTTPGNNCYDTPNPQLRTIILPPDPYPVLNARVPNFDYEEQTVRIIQQPTVPGNQPPWAAGPAMMRARQFADPGIAASMEAGFLLGGSTLGGPDVIGGGNSASTALTAAATNGERVIQYLTQSASGHAPTPKPPRGGGFILGDSTLGGPDVL